MDAVDGWIDGCSGWMDECQWVNSKRVNERMSECGWMDGWMKEWIYEWWNMHGWPNAYEWINWKTRILLLGSYKTWLLPDFNEPKVKRKHHNYVTLIFAIARLKPVRTNHRPHFNVRSRELEHDTVCQPTQNRASLYYSEEELTKIRKKYFRKSEKGS